MALHHIANGHSDLHMYRYVHEFWTVNVICFAFFFSFRLASSCGGELRGVLQLKVSV